MSVANKSGFGERAGKGIRRFGEKNIEVDPEGRDPYSANVGGFSLNARVWIAGSDRKKLERLIRYMARGPLAMERLTESFPNQLLYKMKSPWRDGTTHVSFSPLDFIARLVALIPPPRMNMIRYSGCFAPNEMPMSSSNDAIEKLIRLFEAIKQNYKAEEIPAKYAQDLEAMAKWCLAASALHLDKRERA